MKATWAGALGLDRAGSKGDLEDAQSSGRIRTLGTPVDATPRLCLRLLLEVGRASRVIIAAPPASPTQAAAQGGHLPPAPRFCHGQWPSIPFIFPNPSSKHAAGWSPD